MYILRYLREFFLFPQVRVSTVFPTHTPPLTSVTTRMSHELIHKCIASCVYIHVCAYIPQTEEIGLKIITTAKISNRFSYKSTYISNTFSRSPQNFKQVFSWVDRVPVTQKRIQENWIIWRFKSFKSDLLREWYIYMMYIYIIYIYICTYSHTGVGDVFFA